jgi:hypothetical protein
MTGRNGDHSIATQVPRRRLDAVSLLAIAVIAVPTFITIVRLATLGHVFLGLDLALFDLRVRSALHLHEALGPYDRYGWHHPGPIYFYLLSAVHLVIGDGGRTQFIGAALINLIASLGSIWVVRRHVGRLPALWTAGCLAVLALSETWVAVGVTNQAVAPIGVFLSPWNPYIVLFPLIFFGLLCGVGSTGSWSSLIGGALVGTFTVQTDIATLPLVAVLLAAAVLRAALRAHRRSLSVPWRSIAIGAGMALLLWLPPIFQQLGNRTGNLTRIWRFFSKHGGDRSLTAGVKLVVTADQYLLGTEHQSSLLPVVSNLHASLILGVVLAVALASILLGLRLDAPLGVTLGVASLLGLAISAYVMARIYGMLFSYLLQWEIAVPMLAVIGVGISVLSDSSKHILGSILCVALVGLLIVFSVQMARLPVARASDADVAKAWHIVEPHLPHGNRPIFVGYTGSFDQSDLLFGMVDELETHGFHPRVSTLWQVAIGTAYVTNRPGPIAILMYRQSASVEHMAGYVGRVSNVGIVIDRSS